MIRVSPNHCRSMGQCSPRTPNISEPPALFALCRHVVVVTATFFAVVAKLFHPVAATLVVAVVAATSLAVDF